MNQIRTAQTVFVTFREKTKFYFLLIVLVWLFKSVVSRKRSYFTTSVCCLAHHLGKTSFKEMTQTTNSSVCFPKGKTIRQDCSQLCKMNSFSAIFMMAVVSLKIFRLFYHKIMRILILILQFLAYSANVNAIEPYRMPI